MAARAVADTVRTTLGPQGLDKMLVDSDGSVLITNDGATVLYEMDIEHPTARMIREVSRAQAESVGDGTTMASILAGELLANAEDLLEQGIDATVVASGYQRAASRAEAILDEIATTPSDPGSHLLDVARSALTGKGAMAAADHLAGVVTGAVLTTRRGGDVDTSNIDRRTVTGGSVLDTSLIQGTLVDIPADSKTVDSIRGANTIALIDGDLTLPSTDGEYTVSDPETLTAILDRESDKKRDLAADVVRHGVDLVLTTGEIDPVVRDLLADANIGWVADRDEAVLSRVGKVTDGSPVPTTDSLTDQAVGHAASVGVRDIGGTARLLIENPSSRVATVLVRGGTDHVVTTVDRGIADAIAVVAHTLVGGRTLPGGGATEVEVARRLRDEATSLPGQEQLAVEAYADALEAIPRILAENAGQDPIDTLVDLRSKHDAGTIGAGIAAPTGTVADMWAAGVVSPVPVATSAIQSATEAAVLILRIDDVIASGDLPTESDAPEDQSAPPQSPDSGSVEMAVPDPVSGPMSSVFDSVSLRAVVERSEQQAVPAAVRSVPDDQSTAQTAERAAQVESVSTPTWVPPKQRFPLRLRWTGTVTSVSIHHRDAFAVVDVVGDDPQTTTEHGRTKISADDLGDHGNLIVYLRTTRVPADGTTAKLPTYVEFASGTTRSQTTTVSVNRADLSATVTRQVTVDDRTDGIDIALQNAGELKALVDIEARANGASVAIPGGGVRNLLEGFLNIGVHQREPAAISDGATSDATQPLLRRSCEDVREHLRDDVPPPDPYSPEDLERLATVVSRMLEAESFSPLEPHLDDIRLAYLEESAAVHPNDAIHLSSVIDAVDVPRAAETVEIVIEYEDPNGTRYEPIERQVAVDTTGEREGTTTIPVDVYAEGGD